MGATTELYVRVVCFGRTIIFEIVKLHFRGFVFPFRGFPLSPSCVIPPPALSSSYRCRRRRVLSLSLVLLCSVSHCKCMYFYYYHPPPARHYIIWRLRSHLHSLACYYQWHQCEELEVRMRDRNKQHHHHSTRSSSRSTALTQSLFNHLRTGTEERSINLPPQHEEEPSETQWG